MNSHSKSLYAILPCPVSIPNKGWTLNLKNRHTLCHKQFTLAWFTSSCLNSLADLHWVFQPPFLRPGTQTCSLCIVCHQKADLLPCQAALLARELKQKVITDNTNCNEGYFFLEAFSSMPDVPNRLRSSFRTSSTGTACSRTCLLT